MTPDKIKSRIRSRERQNIVFLVVLVILTGILAGMKDWGAAGASAIITYAMWHRHKETQDYKRFVTTYLQVIDCEKELSAE